MKILKLIRSMFLLVREITKKKSPERIERCIRGELEAPSLAFLNLE